MPITTVGLIRVLETQQPSSDFAEQFKNMLEEFLRGGGNVNESLGRDGKTLLHSAAANGHAEIVYQLLQIPGIDVNRGFVRDGIIGDLPKRAPTPLHLAARNDHTAVVAALLSHPKIQVNHDDRYGNGPLEDALDYDKPLAVKALIADPRVDFNQTKRVKRTVLHMFAERGDTSTFIALLQDSRVVDVNPSNLWGVTPLHLAAHNGHVEIVRALLKDPRVVDANPENEYGFTPLHLAVKKSHAQAVVALIEGGRTDVNVETKNGETILHSAVQGEGEERKIILDSLLNLRRVEVDKKTFGKKNGGVTALYIAAQKGDLYAVKRLIAYGANLNEHAEDGSSPLHAAAQFGNLEVVEYLLGRGADITKVTRFGDTPLKMAKRNNNQSIVDLLSLELEARLHRAAPAASVAGAGIEVGEIVFDSVVDPTISSPHVTEGPGKKRAVEARNPFFGQAAPSSSSAPSSTDAAGRYRVSGAEPNDGADAVAALFGQFADSPPPRPVSSAPEVISMHNPVVGQAAPSSSSAPLPTGAAGSGSRESRFKLTTAVANPLRAGLDLDSPPSSPYASVAASGGESGVTTITVNPVAAASSSGGLLAPGAEVRAKRSGSRIPDLASQYAAVARQDFSVTNPLNLGRQAEALPAADASSGSTVVTNPASIAKGAGFKSLNPLHPAPGRFKLASTRGEETATRNPLVAVAAASEKPTTAVETRGGEVVATSNPSHPSNLAGPTRR